MLATVITGYLIGKAIHLTADFLLKYTKDKLTPPKKYLW